jgi:predicted peptidase
VAHGEKHYVIDLGGEKGLKLKGSGIVKRSIQMVMMSLLTVFMILGCTRIAYLNPVAALELTGLKDEEISFNASLTPAFSPEITSYTLNVQEDIYGVHLIPTAVAGSTITINGQAVEAGKATLIKLEQSYGFYAVDYSVKVEIVVKKDNVSKAYTVNIVRKNAKDTYALFKEFKYHDPATGLIVPYDLYLPANYDPAKKYPLVLALHGSGQRAQSLDMVLKRYKMATIWAEDSEAGINQCIVLAPQCASADDLDNWTTLQMYNNKKAALPYTATAWLDAAYRLLENTMKDYSIDTNKIYATGLSVGGFAAYTIAIEHPDTFAAIVPVCGGADPAKVSALRDKVAIWTFHAADDPLVSSKEYYFTTNAALDKAGVKYKATLYPAGKVFWPLAHFSWTPAYANKEMRDWLFAQSK